MRNIIVATISIVSLLVLCGGLGCAALSNIVTPAEIDPQAVAYAAKAGVADADEYGGYGNLAKAARLKADVAIAHQTVQLGLQQQVEQDDLTYSALNDIVSSNYAAAVQREETLFGPTGLLSLGLTAAGFGTLTGFLGLMRKRPGDVTSAELDSAVTRATEPLSEKARARAKQFAEVVQSVSAILGELKDYPITLDKAKTLMNGIQDSSTQQAVAAVKVALNL